jgi:N-acetylmuramoyl-L-alanine amidase
MSLSRYRLGCALVISNVWLLIVAPAYADEAKLTDINVLPIQSGTTEVVLDFNEPVAHTAFLLQNPNRLVVDFPGTSLSDSNKPLDLSQSGIKDFRHGIQNGIDLRLVFDLQQALQFTSTDKIAPHNFELIFTLNAPSATTVPTVKPTITPSAAVISTPAATDPAVTTPSQPAVTTSAPAIPPTATAATPVTISTDSTLQPAIVVLPTKSKHVFTVVIDAGHGGKDPGTTGPDGTHEKNITLSIANDLEKLVDAQPGMHAVMTREGDYYVGLRQRLMIARKDKGDMFVAIHADAYSDPYATGASVFALSLHGASSEAALWLAQKENYSELGGIDLNGIQDQDAQVRSVLIDLSQTATIGASLQLGNDVIKQLGLMTPLHHGFVEQAPFMVLKSPDIPSILVETGFLSNPKEEAHLSNSTYQKEVAKALMNGIQQYYAQDVPRNLSIATLN